MNWQRFLIFLAGTAIIVLLVVLIVRARPVTAPTNANPANSNTSGNDSTLSRIRDDRRLADIRAIQQGLEAFKTQDGSYPESLDALTTAGLGTIPKDPKTNAPYRYIPLESASSYALTYTLEAGTQGVSVGLHTASPNGLTFPP